MNGPYWMVLFNLLFSLFALIGIFLYRFIYPKKKIKPVVFLIIVAILPLISIFRIGAYESGDFQTHVMEEISFYKLISQGEIYPIWGGDFNATYGYPSFHFTYPLPFYFMSIIHFFGFSFINSIKIFLALTFFSSGLFMYRFLKKIVSEKAAVAGAIFYLFAPYHLIDLHFRADIGEVLAFMFFPLCLLTAYNFLQIRSKKWFILEVLSFSALLLSHPALSLAGFVILSLYILLFITRQKKEKMKLLLLQIGCIASSLFLTAFYWLPIVLELRFTAASKYVPSVTFLQIQDLLYSPWKLGLLFQGPQGHLAFLVGYVQIILLIFAVIILIKNKLPSDLKHYLILSSAIVALMFFLMLSISDPIWRVVPFLRSFQYAYRLHGIAIFSIAIIAALVTNTIKKDWLIFVICFLAVFSTLLNWGNRNTIPQITDSVLQKQMTYLGVQGSPLAQAVTVWSNPNDPWAKKVPTQHMQIIKGEGIIKNLQRDNVHHIYLVNAKTQLFIRENTVYFPGWHVYIDNRPQQIYILNSPIPKGLISFTIPKGVHKISVTFTDTFAITLGKVISGIFFLGGLLLLFMLSLFNNNKLSKKFNTSKLKHIGHHFIPLIKPHTFLLLVCAAFAFYAINLGGQGYSLDEPQTVAVARTILHNGFPTGWDGKVILSSDPMYETIINGNYIWTWHPWLPFYVVVPFYAMFGNAIGFLRIPFIFFGALTVGMVYLLAKDLFRNTRLALLLSLQLLFTLPFFLYMRQIHYYSPSAFFSMVLLWFLFRLTHTNLSKKMFLLFFLCGIFLFFSNYLIWLSSLPLFFVVAFWRKNKKLFITLASEIVLSILWLYFFRPYSGNPLTAYDGPKTIIIHFKALLLNLSYLNNFIFPFLAGILVLYAAVKQKQLFMLFILLAWIGIKVISYSVLVDPHGRFLVDLVPPLILLFGFIYAYLWEKRHYFLIGILFLAVVCSNILSLLPVYVLGTHERSFRFYPQEFAIELSNYYPPVYEQIGQYLANRARPTDIFWTNYNGYTTYFYSDIPFFNSFCNIKTDRFYGPSLTTNPANIRWYIFDKGIEKTLDTVPCFGNKWQQYLLTHYQKKIFPLQEPVYGINDTDIVNRFFPPGTVPPGEIIIYEKK